jgi:hypothetical protein
MPMAWFKIIGGIEAMVPMGASLSLERMAK